MNKFPAEVLNDQVREYFTKLSEDFGYNFNALCTYYFSLLSGLTGTRYKIRTTDTWTQYGTLWTVIVGSKGANKSAPFDVVFDRPIELEISKRKAISLKLREINSELKEAKGEHRKHLLEEQYELKSGRVFVNDATKEALVDALSFNKFGLTLAKDELAGWFRSIERYNSNNNDFWLSSWDGKPFINDRKVDGETTVDNTAIVISGNIQPDVLTELSTSGTTTESGLIDRLLICNIPTVAIKYSLKTLDQDVKDNYNKIVDLITYNISANYNFAQNVIDLDDDLREEFIAYINILEQKKINHELPIMQGIFSKMQKYLARFILLLIIQGGFRQYDDIVKDAIKIIEFYISEAEAMYIERSKGQQVREFLATLKGRSNKDKVLALQGNPDFSDMGASELSKFLGISKSTYYNYSGTAPVSKGRKGRVSKFSINKTVKDGI